MTKEEILELLKKAENDHYNDYLELREALGPEDRSTRYSAAQWNAITTILDKIEENESTGDMDKK